MHEIEPYYGWENTYIASEDERSPFFGRDYDLTRYSTAIYGYYIHPLWDGFGSETFFLKILYANYEEGYTVIELFGEWNDTLYNDIMHFKRNVIEHMLGQGINKFILLGEQVFNFHASDDCYYEEWFEEVEDGWIAALNFRYFVEDEWRKYNIDSYINSGGELNNFDNWRTLNPLQLFNQVNNLMVRRIG